MSRSLLTGREDLGADCLGGEREVALVVRLQVERERVLGFGCAEEDGLLEPRLQTARLVALSAGRDETVPLRRGDGDGEDRGRGAEKRERLECRGRCGKVGRE